ncbi:MAG: prepilin peptidase [Betaproteobacteria bacterium]
MSSGALLFWAALLGLCVGSFLNVVIHRLPRMLEQQWALEVQDGQGAPPGQAPPAEAPASPYSLLRPRSHCPACGHTLAWWELIPVLSFVLLRGRCRACSRPIGWRYPAVELLTAVLFGACAWRWGLSASALLWAGCAACLLALACIDADTQLLPDNLTQPLLWGGLMAAALGWTARGLNDALWGAVAGYGILWAVNGGFALLTRKQGMGQGDFKLLAALGAWLGWQALLPLVLLSSGAGALIGLGRRLSGNLERGEPLAFGPYLALAGLILLFFPDLGSAWWGF